MMSCLVCNLDESFPISQQAQWNLHPERVRIHITHSESATPENRETKKTEIHGVFLRQRHALSMSFDIFVVTYRVTNFLPKLVQMLLFSVEKTEFPFFDCPIFGCCPQNQVDPGAEF